MKNEEFSYKEMQELLPDYTFERISEEDRVRFESTLPNYPDIQKEIEDVRAVFRRVEKMKIDEKINQHTRNLTVKVHSKMNKESLVSPYYKIVKYLVPIGGLAIIALMVFGDYVFVPNQSANNVSNIAIEKPFLKLKPGTIDLVLDSGLSDEEFVEITNSIKMPNNDNSLSNLAEVYIDNELSIDNIINDIINDWLDNDVNYRNNMVYNGYASVTDYLDELPEDEFQLLLKELENEEIIIGS